MSTANRHDRTVRGPGVCTELGWPVLVGALAGVGAGCIEVAWGPVALLLIVAGAWIFLALLLWSAMSEHGYCAGWSARAGLVVAVIAVGLLGLTLLSPIVGGVVATVGAVGLARSGLALTRRLVMETPRESASVSSDQWKVDREFARLVADLETDQS
jgi:hypothetical protein